MVDFKIDFRGENIGVRLSQRGIDDLHICVGIITKDKDWSNAIPYDFSSGWLDELAEKLKDANFQLKYRITNHNRDFRGECLGVQIFYHKSSCLTMIRLMVEDDGYWGPLNVEFEFHASHLDELLEQIELTKQFLQHQIPDKRKNFLGATIQSGWIFNKIYFRKLKLEQLNENRSR